MRRFLCLWAFALVSLPALAQTDKYHITEAEKAACTPDAARLCASTYPDESRLLSCMRTNRTALTLGCRVAFDAGLKKRGIN